MTDQFHEYLYVNTFAVYTDSNSFTCILTSVKLDATGYCWVASIASYNFASNYRSGKANVDADALSCIMWGDHDQHIKAEMVQAIISNAIQVSIIVEAYSSNVQVTVPVDMQGDPEAMSLKDWIIAQSQDPVLREI